MCFARTTPTCRSRPFIVHRSLLPRVAILHTTVLPALALPSKRTWRSGDGRAGEHRIRWVDAYESPGAARKRVRFSCMLARAESRRPNPHKSVALAVQERPFLAALVYAGGPAEHTRPAGGRPVRRPSARGGWNLVWRNRDSFIKSFSTDDARMRRRYIICVRAVEGVALAFGAGRRYR